MSVHFLAFAVAVSACAVPLTAAEPFAGIWRMDPVESSGSIPKAEKVVVRHRGETLHFEITIPEAGPDKRPLVIQYWFPREGGIAHVEKGPYSGVAVKRLGPAAMEITYSTGDKPLRVTRVSLSPDGQTLTSAGEAADPAQAISWVMVFHKQH